MHAKALKQIILVHPISFAGKVIQEFLIEHSVKTYVLEEGEFSNFSYLLSDLKPELFLIHELSYVKNKELFDRELSAYPSIQRGIILAEHIEETKCFNNDQWKVVVPSPYDPTSLYFDLINQLVK